MIRDGKKVDVLDTMFHEMRECVRLQKSLIYAPFIQALIELVCPAEFIDTATYHVSMSKRDMKWTPPAPAPYKAPKVGRNPRAEDRTTFTPGCSSTARLPCQHAPVADLDAPTTFTRQENKSLLKSVANLFKIWQSIQKKQFREGNRYKVDLRRLKAQMGAETGEPQPAGFEDHDSIPSAVSFPLAGWRFDDDDDASSAPPVV